LFITLSIMAYTIGKSADFFLTFQKWSKSLGNSQRLVVARTFSILL
jgi:hypothetical protein